MSRDIAQVRNLAIVLAVVGWLLVFTPISCIHSAYAQKDDDNSAVMSRPVERQFMFMVSLCVDEALWQDNAQRDHNAGRAPESTLGTYIEKMKVCLGQSLILHKPKEKVE